MSLQATSTSLGELCVFDALAWIKLSLTLVGVNPMSTVHHPLVDLARHPDCYVTVAQLATYWQVSRRQIYKQIEAGTLEAIRLGPRLFRIRTQAALEFEERAQMRPAVRAQVG